MIRFVFSAVIISVAATQQTQQRYRIDYEYNNKTDAFYKIHTELASYPRAQLSCAEEGASLMESFPKDLIQARVMLKQFPDLDQIWIAGVTIDTEVGIDTGVGIDISREDYLDINLHDSAVRCNAVTSIGDVKSLQCMRPLPFICKVETKDAPYDPHCKVFSKGYKYYENVGSCYKFSNVAYSWNQAFQECQAEGAHLIILNSELEHQLIYNLTHRTRGVSHAQTPWSWYAGIKAEKSGDGSPPVFKTIFGQTLEEAGFPHWSENEPNNAHNNEYCGSIFLNDGKYNDLQCSHLYAFICEKEVPINSSE